VPASATPNSLRSREGLATKDAKTNAITAPAAVITRPVRVKEWLRDAESKAFAPRVSHSYVLVMAAHKALAALVAGELIDDQALVSAGEDAFRLTDFVTELVAVCERTTLPVNVALFGAWGSGKSSLANLLEQRFKYGEDLYRARSCHSESR
jgi:KAP family P-loop domain